MRIDESSNAATLRLMYIADATRPAAVAATGSEVASDAGGSMSDSSRRERASTATLERTRRVPTETADVAGSTTELPSAAKLASEPRFAALIDLMERLTGREVTLLPPATMMVGARKQTRGVYEQSQPTPSGDVHLTGVRPIDGGQAFRVEATAKRNGGSVESAHFDIDMEVIRVHADVPGARPGRLQVQVGADAVASPPTEPLRIENGGANAVRVIAHDAPLDQHT